MPMRQEPAILMHSLCSGSMVCRFVGLSVCQFASWPVCQLAGMPVCRFVGLSVFRFSGLADGDRFASLAGGDRFASLPVGQFASLPVGQFVSCDRLRTVRTSDILAERGGFDRSRRMLYDGCEFGNRRTPFHCIDTTASLLVLRGRPLRRAVTYEGRGRPTPARLRQRRRSRLRIRVRLVRRFR